MVKQSIIIAVITLFVCLSAQGRPITSGEALSAIELQGRAGGLAGALRLKSDALKLVFTLKGNDGTPLVYAYGKDTGKGFVLASADDEAIPVLGYCDVGAYSEGSLPVQLRDLMEYYGCQIAWQRRHASGSSRRPDWAVMLKERRRFIKPLVKTLWGQHAPYNSLCPLIEGAPCVTGCVATAVAQILAYFHWPLHARGIGHATCDGKSYTLDLTKIRLDYGHMTTYYNERSTGAQKRAVALLMRAAGYGVGMAYSPRGSSANVSARAMSEHFGYKSTASTIRRGGYNDRDWEGAIYSSLAQGSPVIYSGFGNNRGHAFIIDGYQGMGYFHVNWGWNGNSDGYYRLSALAPRDDSRGLSFNEGQEALVNLKPDK